MGLWNWVLYGPTGAKDLTLHGAARKAKFTRNAAPTATLTIGHETEAAERVLALLGTGTPLIWGFRSGASRLAGLLTSIDENAADDALMTLTFSGPFARLLAANGIARYTGPGVVFTATDQAGIVTSLINTANADRTTQITVSASPTGVTRDRTYDRKAVGDAIVEMSQLDNGFDFEVVPLDPPSSPGAALPDLGELNTYYPHQGVDRSSGSGMVSFEYGRGTKANVSAFKRQTLPPINRVTALGANGLPASNEDSISQDAYGLWELQIVAPDVTETATLNAKAVAASRPNPVKVISFTPDPATSPQPWDDYWLGDTVRVRARRGALAEDLAVRVNSIEITFDDDGNEVAHTLEIEEAV